MSILPDFGRDVVLYGAFAAIFIAVYIIAKVILSEEEKNSAQESLIDQDRRSKNKFIQSMRPFYRQYVMPSIRGKKLFDGMRVSYRRKLVTAGLREEFTPDEFIAFKILMTLMTPLFLGMINMLGLYEVTGPYFAGGALFGFFGPDLWVSSLISQRQTKVLQSMPFIVDLLALSTEAGLDFVGAIQKVVEKAKSSPLVDEMGQMLREMKLGSSRSDSLREMAARLGMTEVNSFVAILVSADQMGASIGKILKQQSDQLRVERLLRAEKAGASAATKLLLPMTFLLLPAIGIVVALPFFLDYQSGG